MGLLSVDKHEGLAKKKMGIPWGIPPRNSNSQLGVVAVARAGVLAARAVAGGVLTRPPLALGSCPPLRASAGSIHWVAGAAVLALALLPAAQTVAAVRALLLTLASDIMEEKVETTKLFTHVESNPGSNPHLIPLESGQTLAPATDVVAESPVVAVAPILAAEAIEPRRTRVGAYLTLEVGPPMSTDWSDCPLPTLVGLQRHPSQFTHTHTHTHPNTIAPALTFTILLLQH